MITFENIWLTVLIELRCVNFKTVFLCVSRNVEHVFTQSAFSPILRISSLSKKQDARARPVGDFENLHLAGIRGQN